MCLKAFIIVQFYFGNGNCLGLEQWKVWECGAQGDSELREGIVLYSIFKPLEELTNEQNPTKYEHTTGLSL